MVQLQPSTTFDDRNAEIQKPSNWETNQPDRLSVVTQCCMWHSHRGHAGPQLLQCAPGWWSNLLGTHGLLQRKHTNTRMLKGEQIWKINCGERWSHLNKHRKNKKYIKSMWHHSYKLNRQLNVIFKKGTNTTWLKSNTSKTEKLVWFLFDCFCSVLVTITRLCYSDQWQPQLSLWLTS